MCSGVEGACAQVMATIRLPVLPPNAAWKMSWLKKSTSPGSDSSAVAGTARGSVP